MTKTYSNLWDYLGKRWFKFPAQVERHPTIQKFRQDARRFKTCHAGRRSFKTEIGKRTVVLSAICEAGENFFCGAPTRDQAKRIFWDDVKNLSPKLFVKKISDSALYIKYKNGSRLFVIGFDRPERFQGTRWRGGVLTEFPHFKSNAWDETIMPALRDTHGWCIIEGVPEGAGDTYQKLCDYGKSGIDPEWADYQWKSIDVMDPAEVLKEKGRLDERTFRQEYEGTFETFEGRAYCYYDKDTHCFERPFDSALPVDISCDFNIDPCIWMFGQDTKELTYCFDELKQTQTNVWQMCIGAKEKLIRLLKDKAKNHKVIFYGDYTSSHQRDASAIASSWEIIRQEFAGWNCEFRIKCNPRILDRINSFNSRLRSADGKVHYGHSKNCVELMRDFERVDMEMVRNKINVGDRTHATDAEGYRISYLYPIIQARVINL